MEAIKILIVDDHALVRDGIKALLQNAEGIAIVGEAEEGQEAIRQVSICHPEIILMDIMLPDITGIEAARIIKEKMPQVKVVFLSMEINEELISETIKAGGSGYLPKSIRRDELIKAIKEVHHTGKYYSKSITEVVFNHFYNQSVKVPETIKSGISKRELEVLKLIASGMNKKHIANKLSISIRTVDAHRNHIMDKLNLKTMPDLVKYAIKYNIIAIDH